MKKIGNYLAALLVITICSILSSCMNNLGEATKTTKALSEDLFYMELYGDDGVAELLRRGGAKTTDELAAYISEFLGKGPFQRTITITPKELACTAFIASDGNGGFVVGRNYDWESCKTLIIRNAPSDGYKSISTVDLDFLGFGKGFIPNDIVNQIKALAGIFIPLDGINEKGLVVADLMAGDKEGADQNTDKADLITTAAIRVLLNYADSVDSAIELLGKYDIHAEIGSAHHLFIADKSGKSVDVEWINNEMVVVETPVLTNHYLGEEKYGIGSDVSKTRFNLVTETINAADGIQSNIQAKDILESVKASNYSEYDDTQWSIVYSLNEELKQEFYWRSDFTKSFDFQIN